ncbi:MAG: hypothetical protein JWQ07_1647 [Ramlibacter sp.]|nr:hypothetical protein [Ramlibacter sp.]
MQKLTKLAYGCTALAAASALAQPVDSNKVVTLRAVGPHLNDLVIRHVAKNAEPVVLGHAQFPDARATTPRQIVTKLCGDVRAAYIDEAARANGLKSLALDEPLGSAASTFSWPACLFVSPTPRDKSVVVKAGDKAIEIYQAYTGGGGSKEALGKFFEKTPAQLANLKPGETLRIASVSFTVPLVARSGTGAQLAEEIRRLDPKGTMVREVASQEGDIVLGMAGADGTTAAGPDCLGSAGSPFNVARTVEAYNFATEAAKRSNVLVTGGRSEVAIVDNGFFGAKTQPDGSDAFAGSPFTARFFKPDPNYTISAAIMMGTAVMPLNYSNSLLPDLQSGHGTHVAGLVLGGPDFVTQRETLTPTPWVSLTILNVGRGAKTLLKGAPGLLASRLTADGGSRIVNLSIAHDGRADLEVGNTYETLFDSALRNTLFVVAAGNYGRDVGDQGIYPAAYGGLAKANVITVAALDVAGKLASFSNRSEKLVDLGAPGCQIRSWIDKDRPPVAMSGTSQAAPLVTFAAALLRSIASSARPAALKNRIIVSGDLLDESERGSTAFEVKLNIPQALMWFDDYLKVKDSTQELEYLGSIRSLTTLRCQEKSGANEKNQSDMWALKRSDAGISYFYPGFFSRRALSPCRVVEDDAITLSFVATHQVASNGKVERLPQEINQRWTLKQIQNLVARTPLSELR